MCSYCAKLSYPCDAVVSWLNANHLCRGNNTWYEYYITALNGYPVGYMYL